MKIMNYMYTMCALDEKLPETYKVFPSTKVDFWRPAKILIRKMLSFPTYKVLLFKSQYYLNFYATICHLQPFTL